jgi:hypothetical protein
MVKLFTSPGRHQALAPVYHDTSAAGHYSLRGWTPGLTKLDLESSLTLGMLRYSAPTPCFDAGLQDYLGRVSILGFSENKAGKM